MDVKKKIKKEKIVIVGGFPSKNNKNFGGIVTSCKALTNSSFSQKYEIIPIDSTQISNPIPSIFIRIILAMRRTINFFIKVIIFRPKAVILFTAIKTSILEKGLMAWIAYFLNTPVLMFPRGGIIIDEVKASRFNKFWIKIAFGGASKILCQGPLWQRFAKNELGFKDNDLPIVYNWTATDNLIKLGKKRLMRVHKEPLRVLYLGWIEESKGVFDLLNVSQEIMNEGNDFLLSFVGGGKDDQALKNLSKQNKMNKNVNFYGWLNHDDLENVFYESDILVLPSWVEGFPNSVIEGMASGLAIIATKVGNIPDIINDNIEAILIPPKNRNKLKESIFYLLKNEKIRYKIARQGHQFAIENFSTEIAAKKLDIIIREVISR